MRKVWAASLATCVSLALLGGLLAAPTLVGAAEPGGLGTEIRGNIQQVGGLGGAGFQANQYYEENFFERTIARIISVILGFVGTIFFLLVIYGGLLWMTSAGDQEKVKRARSILSTATIGLAVVLAAFAITWFVYTSLGASTGTAVPPNPAGP